MNEYAILLRLLTQSGNPIGAGVEDMLDALGLPDDVGKHVLFKRLGELEKKLEPIGLKVRFNPVSKVFHLDTHSKLDDVIEDTQLPDRLAATLLIIITLVYQEGKAVSVNRVREFRRKSRRSVLDDIRELRDMGYVEYDRKSDQVQPGARVSFEVDYERFFRRLSGEQ